MPSARSPLPTLIVLGIGLLAGVGTGQLNAPAATAAPVAPSVRATGAPSATALFSSPVPSDRHIVLQGFHWLSSSVRDAQGHPSWYRIIRDNSQRIADSGFSLVWFPPPSDSGDDQGYMPRRLYSLDSKYGSSDELRTAISELANRHIGALADIVVNHRVGTSDWADFTEPSWATNESIASDDEWGGDKSQRPDTGTHEESSRDLDHHSASVQQGIKDWMSWLRDDVGFVGWRYDLVKGYAPWAVELYNRSSRPIFSVGEFLDGDAQKVVSWIDATHPEAAYRSAAFDFPLYFALYDAVVNRAFERLKYADKAAGVIGMWSEKAVTVVKSHDFEEVRQGKYGPAIPADGRLVQAYAVTLTHPGTPVVFWRDIYDSEHEYAIRQLIGIRRCYQITSGSRLFIAKANRGDAYAAYVTGIKGELAMKIGPGPWSPDGDKWLPANTKLLASGGDYAVWGDSGPCPAAPQR